MASIVPDLALYLIRPSRIIDSALSGITKWVVGRIAAKRRTESNNERSDVAQKWRTGDACELCGRVRRDNVVKSANAAPTAAATVLHACIWIPTYERPSSLDVARTRPHGTAAGGPARDANKVAAVATGRQGDVTRWTPVLQPFITAVTSSEQSARHVPSQPQELKSVAPPGSGRVRVRGLHEAQSIKCVQPEPMHLDALRSYELDIPVAIIIIIVVKEVLGVYQSHLYEATHPRLLSRIEG
ncbi:hypothetical protein G7046_g8746 [Stylonectria norvegica]|nr:hypothetical protein G7046_g8746 [Stylonectria norvegica]